MRRLPCPRGRKKALGCNPIEEPASDAQEEEEEGDANASQHSLADQFKGEACADFKEFKVKRREYARGHKAETREEARAFKLKRKEQTQAFRAETREQQAQLVTMHNQKGRAESVKTKQSVPRDEARKFKATQKERTRAFKDERREEAKAFKAKRRERTKGFKTTKRDEATAFKAKRSAEAALEKDANTSTAEDSPFREQLRAFYTKHDKSKIGDVDKQLAEYKGREEALGEVLMNRYGRTPDGWRSPDAF
jgi:hypothetical protein